MMNGPAPNQRIGSGLVSVSEFRAHAGRKRALVCAQARWNGTHLSAIQCTGAKVKERSEEDIWPQEDVKRSEPWVCQNVACQKVVGVPHWHATFFTNTRLS